jgi:hypothetical protein
MDAKRFDALLRTLATAPSRRDVVRGVAGLAGARTLHSLGWEAPPRQRSSRPAHACRRERAVTPNVTTRRAPSVVAVSWRRRNQARKRRNAVAKPCRRPAPARRSAAPRRAATGSVDLLRARASARVAPSWAVAPGSAGMASAAALRVNRSDCNAKPPAIAVRGRVTSPCPNPASASPACP